MSEINDKEFILKGKWPLHDHLPIKRGGGPGMPETFCLLPGEPNVVYDYDFRVVARYKNVDELLKDGWMVD